MIIRRWLSLFAVLVIISGCQNNPIDPSDPAVVRLNGTVTFVSLEGGFWALRGDDGVTYEPSAALPTDYLRDRLRVYFEAKRRNDLASVHMVGPIVDVLSIRPLQ